VLTAGLVAAGTAVSLAQPPERMSQARNMSNAMSKSLQALREDIDIDLPDVRGAELGTLVDRCFLQVRQLQKATRSDTAPAQLHRMAVELDKDLDRLVAATARLGADAYYLRRSAAQINALNENLARIMAPPTIPPRVFALTEQLSQGLGALRGDIDLDLPDDRGKALDAITDRAVVQARDLSRGERFGAPPERLRKQVIDLNRDLQQLVNATKPLGSEGYYLRKSAVNLQATGQELLKALGSP